MIIIEVHRLFERFYTSDISRTKSTGQGLYIVKTIVEKMGFNINAHIEQGNMVITIYY
jgi:signal transduction histidine kinase